MNHNKFVKTALVSAILGLSASSAYAHSILNGGLPADTSQIDVFRTTCFKADGATPLKDAGGNAWTLPLAANATTTDDTANVVWGIGKTDSHSGSVIATVAIANAGNVSGPSGNANNILPAAAGTSSSGFASASTHVTPWESLAGTGAYTAYATTDEPPINVDGTGAVTNWGTATLQATGPDGSTANGEYVIVISHDGSNSHNYDFIFHCTNASASGSATSAHTGQGSIFQNQGNGTISNSADYDQVLDNGAGF
jgi:hypothetical protein